MISKAIIVGTACLALSISAETYEEYQKRTATEYSSYKDTVEKDYATYQAEREAEFKAFSKEIKDMWNGDFKEPTKKKWVEYGTDKKSVSSVLSVENLYPTDFTDTHR